MRKTEFTSYALSQMFDIDPRTARKRLDDAGIKPAGTENGHAVYRLKDAAACLAPPPDHGDDPERMTPRERAYHEQALLTRRKREQMEGTLVDAEDVREQFSQLAKAVIAWLETLPDTLERDANLTPEQVERVEHGVNSLRLEIYDALR